jgi:hypothetical protein
VTFVRNSSPQITACERSLTELQSWLSNCDGVIANVRGGTHWVLLTGWDSSDPSGNTFYVNDPGFDQSTYDYTTMLKFVHYTFS